MIISDRWTINLNDWNISYSTMVKWVIDNNIDVYAINCSGGDGVNLYMFTSSEDFTAFTLKFNKRNIS